jgi:maltooligosyltrehalose trehalohydrolase
VMGPSRVVDHTQFPWTDQRWHGFHLPGAVIYELHIGTFTPAGSFDAAVEHLEHLVELGVDAIEIMPVAEFDGQRGWGYDGVFWYAPHHAYGGPDGLKRLVDAAHHRGLGVILDVVYNHFGPSGNVTGRFGPYLNDAHQTPWGAAVNLDGPEAAAVRRFILDNAAHWLEHYHCDGLRLDAVHALVDDSARHVLEEMAAEVKALAARLGRSLWLVAENERNDPRLVTAPGAGGFGLDGVWADDFHHALHTVLTGESDGYYAGFGSVTDLAKALDRVYVYDGGWSPVQRRAHGRPVGDLDRWHFIVAAQNHDQIGNRAQGERLAALVPQRALLVAAALTLLGPGTPMLFQGEEWGASSPFLFFADFPDRALADAVSNGRRAEFAGFGWDPADIPDPVEESSFLRSKLQWEERSKPDHEAILEWHRQLLSLRQSRPEFTDSRASHNHAIANEEHRWVRLDRSGLSVVANFGDTATEVPLPIPVHVPGLAPVPVERRVLLTSDDGAVLTATALRVPPMAAVIVAVVATG